MPRIESFQSNNSFPLDVPFWLMLLRTEVAFSVLLLATNNLFMFALMNAFIRLESTWSDFSHKFGVIRNKIIRQIQFWRGFSMHTLWCLKRVAVCSGAYDFKRTFQWYYFECWNNHWTINALKWINRLMPTDVY